MGQILHGSARTTEAVRRAIHHSQESLRVLAKRHGINQKTVVKWKRRTPIEGGRLVRSRFDSTIFRVIETQSGSASR